MIDTADRDSSLVDVLRRRAANTPDRLVLAFLKDGEQESERLTFGTLDARARAIAAALQAHGVVAGDRAILLYPPGLAFMPAFFGCLYAGVLAVPASMPLRSHHSKTRLLPIFRDCDPCAVLTTASARENYFDILRRAGVSEQVRWLATDEISADSSAPMRDVPLSPDTIAFLQYTSGSTSEPKGVMVSHGNLLDNTRFQGELFGIRPSSIGLNWMPLSHDMGLIMGVLQPIVHGFMSYVMAPMSFIRSPRRWLAAITRYRVTHSYGPNFAFEECIHRISPDAREGLDLRSWTVACSGAEHLRHRTLKCFESAFSPYGFDRRAWLPAYGLAEATLVVSAEQASSGITTLAVDTDALREGRVIESVQDSPCARTLVAVGKTDTRAVVRVIDPEQRTTCQPDRIGEIWVKGDSVAKGYWQRPEESIRTFAARVVDNGEGPFLRTGDLGFVRNGALFIASRAKDLIILRGRNYYPQDIELCAETADSAIRPSSCIAFSVDDGTQECLVVVAELIHSSFTDTQIACIVENVRQAVQTEHEIRVDFVQLIKRGSLPKTSSGKLQRARCRALYCAGELQLIGENSAGTKIA
ncbi:MAG: fatty acyl-AMP ligase [Aquisalimonadaceae bacterium]